MTFLEKFHTNTNARYNGYFNAKELMKLSTAALEQQHLDNYNEVLPMYKYTEADNPQAVAPDLDIAMKKVSIVVNLYRRSKWTDDCYLLVGQAQYLKQDYESAESTFRYLTGEFDPNAPVTKKARTSSRSSSSQETTAPKLSSKQKQKLAKQKAKERKKYNREVQLNRKKAAAAKAKGKVAPPPPVKPGQQDPKEAEKKAAAEAAQKAKDAAQKAKPDKKGGHRSAFQEAELWLAKTLIERDNHEAAVRILNRLLENPKTYDDVRKEAIAVQAYAFASQKEYERALPLLEQTIDNTTEKKQRTRYTYIAGQLHQRAGRHSDAVAAYEQVLKQSADYEMSFNASLNIALSNAAASSDPGAAVASLEKMLKDVKNEEFKDQIYFALAQIALKAGNKEEGIKNLELALQYSRSNSAQKAEAYFTLAGLYFEDESFVKAKKYYDSTLLVMPATDVRRIDAERIAENLADVAKYLEVISTQDSLLALAALNPKERADMAAKIKAERDEKRRAAAQAAAADANNAGKKFDKNAPFDAGLKGPESPGPTANTSTFFAYNDREIKQGLRDFQREWGNRPLEDNWRRSAKGFGSESEAAGQDGATASSETESAGPLTDAEIKELLGNFPSTEEEVAQVNLKLKEAMFNLGKLYRDKLNRLDKSVEILERLNQRFPANNYELESWYLLYLLFTDMNNSPKAKEYADKIINKYPSSVYGKVLQDPSYVEELNDERRRLNIYYDQAYAKFQGGQYQQAFEQCQSAKEKFGAGNPLQPKFALLSAMCMGNLQGKNAYITGLNEVMSRYPNTPEQTRAREMLRLISGSSAALPGGQTEAALSDGELYKDEPDDLHYVIIFLDKTAPIDKSRNQLSDYNQKYHDLDKLRIANVFLGASNEIPVLVLRRFKDKKESLTYIQGSEKNAQDFLNKSEYGFTVLSISQNNYRNLLRDKRTEVYLEFFNQFYK